MLSRCRPQTERCTLMFDIAGYSLLKGPGASKFIRSASVAVGGHDWCLRFYPNGDSDEVSQGYVSVFLELMSNTDGVMASFDIRLLNQATGVSIVLHNQMTPKLFEYANSNWGTKKFIKLSELDESPYVQGDCLVIECDITVILGTPVSTSETMFDIQVPPSNLSDDLGKLLETGKMADVTFEVQGEVFHAHKFVLAMRSPVFEAELYGPMADKRRRSITVEDMQPGVFKALLHFIYKDLLPAMDDLDGEENEEMVKHLLAAADRMGGANQCSKTSCCCGKESLERKLSNEDGCVHLQPIQRIYPQDLLRCASLLITTCLCDLVSVIKAFRNFCSSQAGHASRYCLRHCKRKANLV